MNTKEILEKQTEVLSHQKNFNLILAFATTLLVLVYSLPGALYFSKHISVILFVITVIDIFMIILLVYLVRKEFPKLLKIVGIKNKEF